MVGAFKGGECGDIVKLKVTEIRIAENLNLGDIESLLHFR